MTSAGSEGSSAINLSELIIHAPPPAASEVHTSLGNIEMGSKYGVPAHLCQYKGKLYISLQVWKGWTHYLDIGANPSVQTTFCQIGTVLLQFSERLSGDDIYDYTAGRCCLYRGTGCFAPLIHLLPGTGVQDRVSNTFALASR